MVVPDFEAIIEIELSAEGFIEATMLAHKFFTLFNLSKELLSKQTHYDWGLRAIKGILRIAGGMKRGEPDKQEIQILMRALRDVNLPKFVQADFGVFLGLIADLFPRVECPKQSDATLVEGIEAHLAGGGRRGAHLADACPLMRDEGDVFISKICSLSELFSVRHCCFILGAAGSSKSEVWRTLAAVQTTLGLGGGKTLAASLNPKAVSSNGTRRRAEPEPVGMALPLARLQATARALPLPWLPPHPLFNAARAIPCQCCACGPSLVNAQTSTVTSTRRPRSSTTA